MRSMYYGTHSESDFRADSTGPSPTAAGIAAISSKKLAPGSVTCENC